MVDPHTFDEALTQASFLAMLRADLIGPDDLLSIADEFALRAERARLPEQQESLERAAHYLRVLAIDHDPPPAVDPEVQFRADFERRQMIERTALLAARSQRDGGNGST